ncbi:hypothetical protein N836_11170 [Leptolyngbya sp. Heron Island J]|uniref:hypothetical protein n=1 Tax=Leptolyngbya sp. Heron Island J TaxID=1385935 RepID=UPI0003B9709B|nr:hypothetical protein [Leptolyngbya sp. Heron Island J]ESA35551.1 hypothetical protein N836_11170 [Leptolyngbya sp. Heron Island J]
MGYITTTITIQVPQSTIFFYLREKYNTQLYKNTFQELIGFAPMPLCIKEVPFSEIEFKDECMNTMSSSFKVQGWRWGYQIQPDSDGKTKVTLWYKWGLLLTLLTFGTAGGQACNELAETALALLALSIDPNADNQTSSFLLSF